MIDDVSYPTDIDSYSYPTKNVDVVIGLIAIFHAITGVLTFPLVYLIFSASFLGAPLEIAFLMIIQGAILAATIPVYLVLGWALWKIQPWAWKVAVIINILCLVFNIVGGVVLTAILNILLLLALNASDVRLGLAPIDS
ncbi:MAG: hypothetical protein E4H14_06865 [Candidatus Thorarchaeota archaeon]|nr:MAG: hypothetical protein E4H14_06865 [Candidatus Thorarchaeota archaeon]